MDEISGTRPLSLSLSLSLTHTHSNKKHTHIVFRAIQLDRQPSNRHRTGVATACIARFALPGFMCVSVCSTRQ